ncbi:hypothetical protein OE88DRAFT_1810252 [Heliocybe sulcata]|uniref:Uncharacterized protein n=1 Tax=Heliocybe sulcata TaxID=5364 RepID=A0A5C3MUU4_9AGAM|nr:hypothetical protein OE88DRAFT_1810252 [Heliocybe sulcata]
MATVHRTIDLALYNLAKDNAEPTPSNIFSSYLRFSAYQEKSPEAVKSFERALEKFPSHSSPTGTLMEHIRKQYWREKLGLPKDCHIVERTCPTCGKKEMMTLDEYLDGHQPVRTENKKKKRVLKCKKTKGRGYCVQPVRSESPLSSSSDPGASTSGTSLDE